MRPLFGFVFGLTLFASLLTVQAQAEDDSVYRVTYVEALPFDVMSPQSGVALELEHYRDASRKEPGNVRFDVLTELGRPNRFVILEVWRNTTSSDAHDKADSTAKFRQAMDKVQSAPLDMPCQCRAVRRSSAARLSRGHGLRHHPCRRDRRPQGRCGGAATVDERRNEEGKRQSALRRVPAEEQTQSFHRCRSLDRPDGRRRTTPRRLTPAPFADSSCRCKARSTTNASTCPCPDSSLRYFCGTKFWSL